MKTLSNKFMHLTNYSINKKNEGAYEANSDENVCQGHKWYVLDRRESESKYFSICKFAGQLGNTRV